ncbi:MAG TPA: hypothetical protein VJ302_21385 [Blastocatellia bacterium]|nr:hypothetical protein [Blastocatellia bacterium]
MASRVVPKVERKPERKPAKTIELTDELRQRVEQLYREQFVATELPWREMVAKISDLLWLHRKAVSVALREVVYPKIEITPETRARIIEMYRDFVERGVRPEGGRRRTISQLLGVPYGQTKDIVFEWSQSQYEQSPTQELSREQKFMIEKLYWDELRERRHPLSELPTSIAERLGYTTAYQIARWLDRLHDDDTKFERVPDVPPEIEQGIQEAYLQYLSTPMPPQSGLHATIAQKLGGLTTRQVHKVLQRYRKQQRAEYPLQ